MNLLDLIILLPVLYAAYKGFSNGLIHEVFGIAGIILAVFVTFEYLRGLSELLARVFGGPSEILTFLSGLILFVTTFALVTYLAVVLQKFIEVIRLNTVNRLFGSVFGGLKISIVISAILLLLSVIHLPGEETRESSIFYTFVIQLAPVAYDFVAAVYPGAADFVTRLQEAFESANPIQNYPI